MTTTTSTPTSLGRRAEEVLERFGDRESLFFEGRWFRSGELAARSHRVASGFVDLGVRPGDRVVVCMANCPEVGLTYSALWRAGAVPTPVLFLLTEEEIRHVVKDSGAVACRHHAGVPAQGAGRRRRAARRRRGRRGRGGVGAAGVRSTSCRWSTATGDDLAALLYTGGTTGRSKGVALSHASLDAAGAAGAESAYSPGRNRGLLPLPLAHAYGLLVTVAGLHAREPGTSVPDAVVRPGRLGRAGRGAPRADQRARAVDDPDAARAAARGARPVLPRAGRLGCRAALGRRRRGVRAPRPGLRDPRGLRLHRDQRADQHPAATSAGSARSASRSPASRCASRSRRHRPPAPARTARSASPDRH